MCSAITPGWIAIYLIIVGIAAIGIAEALNCRSTKEN